MIHQLDKQFHTRSRPYTEALLEETERAKECGDNERAARYLKLMHMQAQRAEKMKC